MPIPLEVPAVLSVKGILQKVKNGDSIIIDGAYGEVFINPTQRTFSIYEKKKKRYEEHIEELKTFINKSTETADGKKVMLAANIGGADEAAKAVKAGAEGVGLFRTEFLFLNKNALPTEEEQFEEYKKAAVLTKGMPLTIRTLDIGGDKDIPYMGLTKEANPFLGYRAIRFCLDRVDIFTTQLRAILRASAYGSIRIMIPMITSVNEVRQVKELIKKICSDLDRNGINYDKNIQTGVMIETPAAAVMADVIAQEADFFSIGTNDLTQYTIAVDRCNENVAYLYSAFNPAVLRLIRRIIEYKSYKEITKKLKENFIQYSKRFYKTAEEIKLPKQKIEKKYDDTIIPEIYKSIIQKNSEKINENAANIEKIAITETYSVGDTVKQMYRSLLRFKKFTFNKLFSLKKHDKREVVTAFSGLLEMSIRNKVITEQEKLFGDIEVEKSRNKNIID